jgi:hypothetical protein
MVVVDQDVVALEPIARMLHHQFFRARGSLVRAVTLQSGAVAWDARVQGFSAPRLPRQGFHAVKPKVAAT